MRRHTGVSILLLLVLTGVLLSGTAGGEQKALFDRVIIVGIDGSGAYFKETDTPCLDRIFADGNITWEAHAQVPTISAQGWGSVMYGMAPETHMLTNAAAESRLLKRHGMKSIFSLVLEKYSGAEAASVVGWPPINHGILDRPEGLYRFPEAAGKNPDWSAETEALDTWLDGHDPKLLFIHYEAVDVAGHAYGYGSAKYLEAVRTADTNLGKLYDDLDSRGLIEGSLFIVTADHGGVRGGTTHGGSRDEEVNCMFCVKGDGVLTGTEIQDMELRDIAAVALYALGVEQPENMTGRVPSGIFEGAGGEERPKDTAAELRSLIRQWTTKEDPGRELPEGLSGSLAYYQGFEDGNKKLSGKRKLTEEGFYGSAMDAEKTYLKTGTVWKKEWEGFSACMWIRIRETEPWDPVLFSNSNWKKGTNLGMTIALEPGTIVVSIGNGKKTQYRAEFALPDSYTAGWMHLLVSVNLEEGTATAWADFCEIGWDEFIPAGTDMSKFMTRRGINVGQDVTGSFKRWLHAAVDEVMIFNRTLNGDDVEALRKYYFPD